MRGEFEKFLDEQTGEANTWIVRFDTGFTRGERVFHSESDMMEYVDGLSEDDGNLFVTTHKVYDAWYEFYCR